MNTREYGKLCIKAATGNVNRDEEELLKNWLAKSEDNRKEFESIQMIWTNTSLKEGAQIPDVDTEIEWIRLNEKIENEKRVVISKDSILSKLLSSLRPVFTPSWKPALGFTLALIFIFSLFIINPENSISKNLTAFTVNKEHKMIQLSDGTTVLLNNNSSLTYPETFTGNNRQVTLSGEAFFSVTKDTRPFIIMTENAKTTVLGTKFDVWARGDKTKVIVKEGRVNLAAKLEDKGVVLTKNQQSLVIQNMKSSRPEEVESSYLLGWMNNKLVFDKSPLNDVVDELERFYDVKLLLASENLKSYTLTGSFKNNDIDSALTMICLALDLKYEKQKGAYLIEPKLD